MSKLHDALVNHVTNKYPDAATGGFHKWWRSETGHDPSARPRFLPDAWRVVSDPGFLWRKLYLYEAEDTSRLSVLKLHTIGDFWYSCDFECIDMRLVIVSPGFIELEIDGEGLFQAVEGIDAIDDTRSPSTIIHDALTWCQTRKI